MLHDPIANMMSKILNGERRNQTECLIKPISKLSKEIMAVLRENHYIGEFTELEDGRGNAAKVVLLGRINQCNAIKPRYPIHVSDFEKFEKRYLPAKGFGIIIISTNQGVMTLEQAREKKAGGRLIAYCY